MAARDPRGSKDDCGDDVKLGPYDVERVGGSGEADVSDAGEPRNRAH